MEDSGRSKIDELDDIIRCHDAIVEFEITMRQTQLVQILDTVADLPEHAINLWATHLPRHDDAEQVIWRIFHNLKCRGIGD